MKIKKQFGLCTNNKIIVLIMLTTSQHPVGFFVCFFFLIWSPRKIRWQSSGCILSCVKRSIKKIKKEKKLHKNLYTFYLNLQGKYINKQSLGLVYGQLLGGPVFVCERVDLHWSSIVCLKVDSLMSHQGIRSGVSKWNNANLLTRCSYLCHEQQVKDLLHLQMLKSAIFLSTYWHIL